MNKEELKNIVSEILGNSDDSTFNQFIEKIASSIDGNQALKLDGIGHFQIKKEPLSRMERKLEGSISDKEILLFLPEGEFDEDSIISFKIDEQIAIQNEFNESVFDVRINRPTIISDPESEVTDEKSSTGDETILKILNSIDEFIESGEVIEGYKLLDGAQSNVIQIDEDENINNEEIITDDIMIENSDDDFTEAEINKEFINKDTDNETVEDDDEYEVASSSVEPEITKDDVSTSEAEIPKTDNEIEEEVESETIEPSKKETNPFDELNDYIKDETHEVVDAEQERMEKGDEELESDSSFVNSTEADEKSNELYKNPILYIATLSFIVAIVVIYIFLPTGTETIIGDESNSIELSNTDNNQDKLGVIDSVVVDDSTMEDSISVISGQATDEKTDKIKKVEEVVPVTEKNVSITKVIKPKMNNTPTGLYREIKNDQAVTKGVYFDGERYTVQSSSWKSTTIAEREVSKLKKRGFDAFIYKAFIASKNGTWNRVRIGYFSTQKEAEEFLKKNKI